MDAKNLHRLIPAEQLRGEDAGETEQLREMLREARRYLSEHEWYHGSVAEYLGFGVGGVVAVFLFQLADPINSDDYLWVVQGDLPSAYFVTENAPTPAAALEVYCQLMEDWIEAVLAGVGLNEAFPVEAAPTTDNAKALKSRVSFIRRKLVPMAHLAAK